jgi:hypothetical protein
MIYFIRFIDIPVYVGKYFHIKVCRTCIICSFASGHDSTLESIWYTCKLKLIQKYCKYWANCYYIWSFQCLSSIIESYLKHAWNTLIHWGSFIHCYLVKKLSLNSCTVRFSRLTVKAVSVRCFKICPLYFVCCSHLFISIATNKSYYKQTFLSSY